MTALRQNAIMELEKKAAFARLEKLRKKEPLLMMLLN